MWWRKGLPSWKIRDKQAATNYLSSSSTRLSSTYRGSVPARKSCLLMIHLFASHHIMHTKKDIMTSIAVCFCLNVLLHSLTQPSSSSSNTKFYTHIFGCSPKKYSKLFFLSCRTERFLCCVFSFLSGHGLSTFWCLLNTCAAVVQRSLRK